MNNGTILKQRYKILRHIGSGGMAEVYLAEDLLLNRQVAVCCTAFQPFYHKYF